MLASRVAEAGAGAESISIGGSACEAASPLARAPTNRMTSNLVTKPSCANKVKKG